MLIECAMLSVLADALPFNWLESAPYATAPSVGTLVFQVIEAESAVGRALRLLITMEEATVKVVEAVTLPFLAVMTVVPSPRAVTRPFASTVATLVTEERHSTFVVRSSVVLSLNVPIALNCSEPPTAIPGFEGETLSDDRPTPLPVRLTETSPLSVVNVRVADSSPLAVGAKLTFQLAEPPAGIFPGEAGGATLKSSLLTPSILYSGKLKKSVP